MQSINSHRLFTLLRYAGSRSPATYRFPFGYILLLYVVCVRGAGRTYIVEQMACQPGYLLTGGIVEKHWAVHDVHLARLQHHQEPTANRTILRNEVVPGPGENCYHSTSGKPLTTTY